MLSVLCILIGYSIFGTYALSLRFNFDFPIDVYWLSFVFVSIPLLLEASLWKCGSKLRLFYLLMFSLMIHLQYGVVDSSPFLSSPDAVGDYRLTEKIITDTQWMPFVPVEWGFGSEYRFYPIANFLYATTSLLTGIPLLIVVKYLFVIKALVVPPLIERWFRSFFNQRVSYLATVIFLASPGAILFPHKESFAMIFFFTGLYVSTKIEKTREYLLIGLVSVFTLIMTHHFSTYIFLVLLTSMFLASHFFKREKVLKVSSQFLMLCWVVFISWVAFIAWTITTTHQKFLFNMFFEVLLPGQLIFSELLPLYAPHERIVVWLGAGITLVSTGIGFLLYAKNMRSFTRGRASFFAMTLFLIPLLAVATIFRFSSATLNVLISHRAYEFGYIIVGAFSALFFIKAFQILRKPTLKGVLISIIAILIIFGPMAGAMHPRTFARVSDVISPRAISLNSWMSGSDANDKYTIVDRVTNLIMGGYGTSLVVLYPELFVSPDFNLPWDIRSKSSYVVTYEYMKDFYGPNAAKFDGSPYFHNLYTNGVLNVYGISNRTSS